MFPTQIALVASRGPSPSTVAFPGSDTVAKNVQPVPHIRPPHLPFRRISLPTAPSLMHRESVISVASFDSLPEEGEQSSSSVPYVIRSAHPPRAGKGRPTSIESPRRRRKREIAVKPLDDARESKRRKVIDEFFETERAYVDGLELIYSHFLTPIIASLDTPTPLLDRSALTSVFSNFIDIWNLHRSFFSSLSSLLSKTTYPPISPILLAHFPYLSLYNPFVTAFPSTISALSDLISSSPTAQSNAHYSPTFASFLSTQEADPRCGKLKLRDWLLTIVQRCPRYLLLLKDLINCTDTDDPEHGQLTAVHTLVSKITLSLNTSLHTHTQTLALLSLQRSTPNLPFQLIVPGRTLLKRGPLLQIERSAQPREREFLLFSDCLIWLAGEETERAWKGDWGISRAGWSGSSTGGESPLSSSPLSRPPIVRTRSKSEAELSLLKAREHRPAAGESDIESPSPSTPTTPSKHAGRNAQQARKSYHPPPNAIRRHASSGNGEERWVYKGRAELVDLEVVVSPPRDLGDERRFEVLGPEGSFVLYAATEEERDDWSSSIRQAKSQLLISLNVTHPNSTLTSSSSTNHLRRSLQALPFPPSDERIATTTRDLKLGAKASKAKSKRNGNSTEMRGKVEHWVPAIWIPDEKTASCMRCGRAFGWRRRRHHCRLCGRCVCASCSGRTFFISDPSSKSDSSKPARACDACYETVFPLLDHPPESAGTLGHSQGNVDTITSLNHFPSWLSIPSLPSSTPQALMAIDREPPRDVPTVIHEEEAADLGADRQARVRLRSHSTRPRSYHQILEDFEDMDQGRFDILNLPLEEGEGEGGDLSGAGTGYLGLTRDSSLTSSGPMSASSSPRREDTARRNKRFSLPAVALQTTSVTATTGFGDGDTSHGAGGGGASQLRPNKRFSLVLGGSRHHGQGPRTHNEMASKWGKAENELDAKGKGEVGKSVAAGKLSELLGRRKE
ncbi:hypothetical protein BDZ94DRAFT_1224932 [Collybia nuda]|uniref:Uncharacterized protein n=1 Tax=Collybia nuda TaxID=64659 RepID=A0A9P5Y0W8_9AGAR|nr:hypothetical protein BDZ94DRAFT_1224932 [Collybia nuda]